MVAQKETVMSQALIPLLAKNGLQRGLEFFESVGAFEVEIYR
jgi:hypothetical protein